MRIGPFEILPARQAAAMRKKAQGADLITNFVPNGASWWPILREGFSGAWRPDGDAQPVVFAGAR